MAASDHLQPQQFYHGSSRELEPGAKLTGQSLGGLPRGEAWRDRRVWMAATPEHAREWTALGSGHIYEVQPNKPRLHDKLTEFDSMADVSQEALDNQYHAPSATVIRKLM